MIILFSILMLKQQEINTIGVDLFNLFWKKIVCVTISCMNLKSRLSSVVENWSIIINVAFTQKASSI